MTGVVYDPVAKTLEFKNGSRKVMVGAGQMVCLLPTLETFTGKTATFPDFGKDNLYFHRGVAHLAFSTLDRFEACACYITALPQEYAAKTVLMDAPAGADFFMGQFKLSRTTAPANTWRGTALAVLPKQAEWMQLTGSCLLEAVLGMSRALHIYIDNEIGSPTYRKLVMEVEQSVGPPPGGYIAPSIAGGSGGTSRATYEAVNSQNNASAAYCGIPIFLRDSASRVYGSSAFGGTALTNANIPISMIHDGAQACARNDTTNYSSIYSIDIRGRFGRRS